MPPSGVENEVVGGSSVPTAGTKTIMVSLIAMCKIQYA